MNRLWKRYFRAVLPEAFERVENSLLSMLNVDDNIDEIEQNPAPFLLTLTAYGLDPKPPKPVLHSIDDGPHLSVVRG